MKLSIESTCQGHGRCYEVAPKLFTDDDRGYGVVTVPDVPESSLADARAAVSVCPERAVLLGEDQGGRDDE